MGQKPTLVENIYETLPGMYRGIFSATPPRYRARVLGRLLSMGMDGRREASEEALRVFHSRNALVMTMTQSLANVLFLKANELSTQEEVRKNVASLMAQECLEVGTVKEIQKSSSPGPMVEEVD